MSWAFNIPFKVERGAPLPYDAEVEYLEGTGTQWLNTGVMSGDINGYDIGFGISAGYPSYMSLFGQQSYFHFRIGVMPGGSNYCRIQAHLKNAEVYSGWFPTLDEPHRAVFLHGECLGDNTRYGTYEDTGTFALVSQPHWILRGYNGISVGRIYHAKIYGTDGDTLIRDFMPVRKDGIGMFYDRVSGELFGNSGTGEFIIGPDI